MTGGAAPARSGYHFEQRVRGDLAVSYLVGRNGGSRGLWDLVAMRAPRQLVLVQCKVDGRMDPGEWNELLAVADEVGAIAVLAQREQPGHRLIYRRLLQRKDHVRNGTALWEPWEPARGVDW
jgi:hypothetical protein